MTRRALLRREEGQIIPALVVVLLVCLALGLMMLQVGLASTYKSRAQTAADAGALAGALDVERQISTSPYEFITPAQVNWAAACAQAQSFAARNNATVTSCRPADPTSFDIKVEVIGNDKLDDIGDAKLDEGDRQAEAKARATPFGGGGGFGAPGVPAGSAVGSSDDLHGADPKLKPYADAAARFGLVITAGRVDHSIYTSTGNRSLHADGHALDFGAPGYPSPDAKRRLLAFAEYASEHWGAQLEELIHTPLGGRQINDGHYFVYTGITAQQHYNHVHLADVNPGGGPSGPPSGSPGGGGGVLPGGGFGGFGSLQVHLVRWDGKGGRQPSFPGLAGNGNWTIPADVVLCESGGQNLPPNSAQASGYYQFIPSTWAGMGGSTAHAYQASKAEQDLLAGRLWNSPGGPANWDCAKCLNYATGICPKDGQMHYATRSPVIGRSS